MPHELQRKCIVLMERRNPASFHNGSRNHCRLSRRWISAPLCLCSGYCCADIVLAGVSGLFLYAIGFWSRGILAVHGCLSPWLHNRVCAVATCNTPLAVTNGSFAFVFLLRVQTKPFVAYYVIIAGISTRCLCTGFWPHVGAADFGLLLNIVLIKKRHHVHSIGVNKKNGKSFSAIFKKIAIAKTTHQR